MTSTDARTTERTFTRMDESTAEQWQTIAVRDGHQSAPGGRPGARAAALAGRHHRRVRGRPADPLAPDRDPGRGGGSRHRDGGGQPLPRHRQGGLGQRTTRRSRPRCCGPTCPTSRLPGDRGPPGLPGPPLLRVLHARPRVPGPVRGRALVRAGRALRRRLGPDQLRPRLPDPAARALRADGPGGLRPPPFRSERRGGSTGDGERRRRTASSAGSRGSRSSRSKRRCATSRRATAPSSSPRSWRSSARTRRPTTSATS